MKSIGFKALVGLGDDDVLHEWRVIQFPPEMDEN